MTVIRRIDFDEFAAQLPEVLEELAREHGQILVEKKGKLFRVEATEEMKPHDPERVRGILARNSGAMRTVDIEALKRDLREERQQASEGRPD